MAIRYFMGRGITYGQTVFHGPWNNVRESYIDYPDFYMVGNK